jgi:KaiC/GvpD/RAD55 family RecA-like ATPase
MNVTHLEKIFFHYVEKRPELEDIISGRFFETIDIRELFDARKEFKNKYHEYPSRQQVKEILKLKGIHDRITPEKVDVIYDIDLSQYEDNWLESTTEAWVEYKNLDLSLIDAVTYMKTSKVNAENIGEIVTMIKSIINDRNSIDFTFDKGLDFYDPESHKQTTYSRFSTGYDYFDKVLGGGYSLKTLISLAGMPKVGKSLILGNLACQGVKMGYNVAYISLEMADAKIVKRLGSNMLNIKISEYDRISQDNFEMKQRLNKFKNNAEDFQLPGELRVKEFPTSTAGVPDIENWLKKTQELDGKKFKLVVVDYIGIMKNWRNPNSENTYMKIKQVAEDLRAMAMRNDWCVLTASQFNRGAYSNSDVTLEHIAESSALIHTVDCLMGIIQDEMMYAASEYYIKTLANREEGWKNSKKRFIVSYDFMRIREDMDSAIIESTY